MRLLLRSPYPIPYPWALEQPAAYAGEIVLLSHFLHSWLLWALVRHQVRKAPYRGPCPLYMCRWFRVGKACRMPAGVTISGGHILSPIHASIFASLRSLVGTSRSYLSTEVHNKSLFHLPIWE